MGAPDFDPVIHAPQRLRICSFLAPLEEAEFSSLREALDVRDPVISKHVSRLEEEGYVRVRQDTFDRRRRWIALTPRGRGAFESHVSALRELAGWEAG